MATVGALARKVSRQEWQRRKATPYVPAPCPAPVISIDQMREVIKMLIEMGALDPPPDARDTGSMATLRQMLREKGQQVGR